MDPNQLTLDIPLQTVRRAPAPVDDAAKRELELRLLARASGLVSNSLEAPANLQAVVRLMVPSVADLCFVDVVDERGVLRRLEVACADPSTKARADVARAPATDAKTPQSQVLHSSAPVAIPDCAAFGALCDGVEQDPLVAACGGKSLLAVPLVARGRTLGVLTMAMAESERRYTFADLAFAQDVASRAAVALDNARLYQEAKRAIQARDDVLSIVCHDLRNPLWSITLGLAAMARTTPPNERRKERKQLEVIRNSVKRMQHLTEDLLDLTSIEAGHLAVNRVEHEINGVVTEAFEIFSPMAREKQIDLKAELHERPLRVLCDRERILQAFSNMVGNALKFTPKGGQVVISVDATDDQARVRIRDTGPGIPPERLRTVFDRFWQAKPHAGGRGLGLYISRGIVEAQGGAIWAESEVGVGTTFIVTLPFAHATPCANRPTKGRVLIIEDDRDSRESLTDVFELRGYEVAHAANGVEAMERLSESDALPQLILLDLQMPRMDGWQFMGHVRRQPALCAIPVVLVSSRENLEAAAHALGAAGYLRKPLRIDRLLEMIEGLQSKPATIP